MTAPLVVKLGGSVGDAVDAACADVATLWHERRDIVLVHGGGSDADALAADLGRPPRWLTSPGGVRSRYTDAAALDALTLALRGRVAPRVVTALGRLGVPAASVAGFDARAVVARRKDALKTVEDGRVRVVRDDHSGRIDAVDATLARTLLAARIVPVVSPPAVTRDGALVNVDADRLAAALAGALGAPTLVILSDVPGLLTHPGDPATLVERVSSDDFDAALALARGRMKLKVIAAREALRGGVATVVVADGTRPAPVRAALARGGTTFTYGELVEDA
ncbi:MAG TPA: [LysW]-aminoadipate kinase [Actinomycetota bacterium]|nr:[LysW]-aminoadipate kinase [Actinomycetota bacterium]